MAHVLQFDALVEKNEAHKSDNIVDSIQQTCMSAQSHALSWWRRCPDITWKLIALNAGVFALWRLPMAQRAMTNHFTCSWRGCSKGRVWTLLTATYSHAGGLHFALNMATLALLGPSVERTFGSTEFLKLYTFGGVVSNAGFLLQQRLRGYTASYGLGASGCLMALWGAYARHYPDSQVLVLGLVPMTAQNALFLFMALDFLGMTSGLGLVGFAAHLTGACVGMGYYEAHLRRRLEEQHNVWRRLRNRF
eukprot:EG_transcript_24803